MARRRRWSSSSLRIVECGSRGWLSVVALVASVVSRRWSRRRESVASRRGVATGDVVGRVGRVAFVALVEHKSRGVGVAWRGVAWRRW
ncbi:hypothetical protein ACXZ9C_11275 [Streptococcus agalactiae]